ncbi:hypothetical protein [Marinifilum flexuosum]|uniref:Uncharacterized protein n=1 Tax=Marinifilum flexuosum TaxID=1117708 RepID=A0A419X3K0_9BACT|nr:hypothetical protein [Marinifilum flexuosum]RKE02305.1 hypothetical protein BXY64_2393 [Marinifilum flexuosum]
MAEKKSQPKTQVEYNGKTYPYYQTNRGMFDFENSEFTAEDLKTRSRSAMLAQIYYQLRDCAKRAGMVFEDSFDDFVDKSEPEIIQVFERLLEEAAKLTKGEEGKN